jgi:hypothetical protein
MLPSSSTRVGEDAVADAVGDRAVVGAGLEDDREALVDVGSGDLHVDLHAVAHRLPL